MTTQKASPTFVLFLEPSFWEGFSRALDLGNTMTVYNSSSSEDEADYDALRRDWLAIGNDIKFALDEHGKATRTRSIQK